VTDRPAAIERKPWTANQVLFQAWLALPVMAREPPLQSQLARKLGVRESTLSVWKGLPGWSDAVYELARAAMTADLTPILHAQVRKAREGSLPHAQWLFELAGKWAPSKRLDHTGNEQRLIITRIQESPPPKPSIEGEVRIIEAPNGHDR
jgi:hypothetical protein